MSFLPHLSELRDTIWQLSTTPNPSLGVFVHKYILQNSQSPWDLLFKIRNFLQKGKKLFRQKRSKINKQKKIIRILSNWKVSKIKIPTFSFIEEKNVYSYLYPGYNYFTARKGKTKEKYICRLTPNISIQNSRFHFKKHFPIQSQINKKPKEEQVIVFISN